VAFSEAAAGAARRREGGFTVLELLMASSILLILAAISLVPARESLARQQLETATRRVLLGLDRGRLAAERRGQPCALAFDDALGWRPPQGGELAACEQDPIGLGEGAQDEGTLQVEHNLPKAVRFTANGLLLDGGTVVLRHAHTTLARCVVVSLPLGVTRVGLHGQGGCLPDPAL
jgi:prepilin-type N-terminal cleavage/methylation domain-containing protein